MCLWWVEGVGDDRICYVILQGVDVSCLMGFQVLSQDNNENVYHCTCMYAQSLY